jgi:hypothetical protein
MGEIYNPYKIKTKEEAMEETIREDIGGSYAITEEERLAQAPVETTPQPELPVFDTEQPYAAYDPDLYQEEAAEDIATVSAPMLEGFETQKEAVDIGAEMQIAGIEKAIPYVTRQFEAYQAKHGIGTGMQARQSNELIMDIAETVGDVYDKATLAKLGIDSKISEYQSAMAAGELARATELYNQAQSQAMFASEVLGQPYVQPEIGYIYDQMQGHQSIIDSLDASEAEKATAQTAYDGLTQTLKDLGYTGDIGEGLQTYQNYQREMEQYLLEMNDWIASETYDFQMYSQSQTWYALREMQEGKTWEEVLSIFPYADHDFIIEIQGKLTSGELDWQSVLEDMATTSEETP